MENSSEINNDKIIKTFNNADIMETKFREYMPDILDVLLLDRTKTSKKSMKNIIWANENYIKYGMKAYAPTAQIKPELITGYMGHIIKPRSIKPKELQKQRTKAKGEVFTPTWIVKQQNDEVDKSYRGDDLETYIGRLWLEITCGEAPYMVSRYDMETGKIIPLNDRVGFVDRKLQRINKEVDDKNDWQNLVNEAYKSSYGFEWSGDSLLLARENLLYTYRDYYYAKWLEEPMHSSFMNIAEIISYNVFQMDGLKYIIPLSEEDKDMATLQLSLFQQDINRKKVRGGNRVKIMNWKKNKMEFFDKGVV